MEKEAATTNLSPSIFLTGFGAFGEYKTNPSWLAVQEVSKIWPNKGEIHIKEIPVEYKYVEENVPKYLEDIKPKISVNVGVSGLAEDKLQLEYCAHSSDYVKPDIDGCIGPDCSKDVCLTTKFDLKKLIACCTGSALPVERSDNAGRYLCEFIYYTSMKTDECPSLFVHVPVITEEITLEKITKTLESIIKACIQQV
ncbi:pyroglutamyl-peptidase 1-like [Clytia hemisphaerica]|uniref:Uncharacterized protein n=1 Tax=Clytia hemisphaerica TaxID=252671 RepID=A0A7M5XLC5_9CNID